MPDWFNDLADVPVIILLLSTFFGALMWVIKREVSDVKHEMFPNSGKSMRDVVDRMEERQIRIEEKLDDHITWHITHKE
jgi:hypothetical protein